MALYEQELGRLVAHLDTRSSYAEDARRRTSDASIFIIDRYLGAALGLAREDQRSFPEDFGTSPPAQLAYALETEIESWQRLNEALLDFQASDPLPRDVVAYAGNVRRYLTHQLRLLDTERDLLHSCLGVQYVREIDLLKQELCEVQL